MPHRNRLSPFRDSGQVERPAVHLALRDGRCVAPAIDAAVHDGPRDIRNLERSG